MAQQKQGNTREGLVRVVHSPRNIRHLLPPRRLAIAAALALLSSRILRSEPEATLVVCEDSDTPRGEAGVEVRKAPAVFCEAVQCDDDGFGRVSGHVCPREELRGAGPTEPGFSGCKSSGHGVQTRAGIVLRGTPLRGLPQLRH